MSDLRKLYADQMAAFNEKGVWDRDAYNKLKDLEGRIALLPPDPEPQPELKLEKPKGR